MKQLDLTNEVYLYEASVNYTILHFADGKSEMSAYTLKKFEQLLASNSSYVRIHKSFMINRKFIKEIMTTNVVLHSGRQVPVARRRNV